jgi:hypothetical protein
MTTSKILFFFLNRIKFRIVKIIFGRYNKINYPAYIKNLIKLDKYFATNLNFNPLLIKLKKNLQIELASSKIVLKDSFKWINYDIQYFSDTEDYEAFHRWKWIIKALSENKINRNNYTWFLNQVIIWYKVYNLKDNKKNYLIWETYNVSERICNLILSSKLLNFKLPKEIKVILDDHINYLIDNLEFFGDNTSNHIINNARALYLFGSHYNNKRISKIAEVILLNELPKLLDRDNMLNEGSTHYHFLVQTWILEIYFFLDKNNNKINSKILKIIAKMNTVSNFFKKNMAYFPKFGDISPDCSPYWINDIEKSIFFKKNYKYSTGTWNYLWRNEKIKRIKHIYSDNVILKNSGFVRLKSEDQIVFFRSAPSLSLDKLSILNHGHDDIGHFLYYYKNIPILADAGGYSYSSIKEKFGKYHNLVHTRSSLISMNLVKHFFFNCLFLDCKISVKNFNKNKSIIFTKKSKIFCNFFLNISRKVNISKNYLHLHDEILNKSIEAREIITFGHNINIKKNKSILRSPKGEKCNLKFNHNLNINGNSVLRRYDVIKYGERILTESFIKKFSRNNEKKYQLEFNWKN